MGEVSLTGGVLAMEELGGGAEVVGLAADLVEGGEAVVDIEGGILDAFGGDGACALLEFHDEAEVGGTAGFVEVLGESEEEGFAEELEDGGFHAGVAAAGGADGAVDDLAVIIAQVTAGFGISAIDGEASDDFADGGRKGGQGKVAIPAVLLREAVEHVGEDVDLAGEGKLHGKLLLSIDQISETGIVAYEAPVGFGKLFLGGAVNQDLGKLIGEVVAGGAVDGPVGAEFLAGHEDLFDEEV